ncbi:MAG: hypothetical protein JW800_01600, partial [Candidatus Omnitrophica bacterium]|nr:hypothetical protein [Candidatus Omnitrophota bacterium]
FLSVKIKTYQYCKKYRMRISLFRRMRLPASYYENSLALALKIWIGTILIAGVTYLVIFYLILYPSI